MALDPIRTSEVRDVLEWAAAKAVAKIDAATVRRIGEVAPSDPVIALEGPISGRSETKKVRVTVTVTPLIDAVADKRVADTPEAAVERFEAAKAKREEA